jgi:hypothetical protein
MNTIIRISCSAALALILVGCGSSEGGFTGTDPAGTGSNIISAKHFVLAFSETNPAVYDEATGVTTIDVEVDISVTAGNRYDAAVTSGTVHFRTELGILSADTCNLGADGTCSVKWTSVIDPADLTPDYINTVTAYTLTGEDGFRDNNANNIFDAGDILTDDMGDPFLDMSHDNSVSLTYDPGIDLLLIDGNYDAPNGIYDGPECGNGIPPPGCGSSSTVIFDTSNMDLFKAATP